jgi:transposase
MKKRKFSVEFKRESASLIVDKHYRMKEACDAVGVGESVLRRWVKQLRAERTGNTPSSGKALTQEHQRIQALEAQVKRLEMEKEILKKATALLMSDTLRSC